MITYYVEAPFIVRSLLPFSIGEGKAGRESIWGQFSEVVLMDFCGQLNPLFATGKVRLCLDYSELK